MKSAAGLCYYLLVQPWLRSYRSAYSAHSSATGSVKKNVLPLPTSLSTQTRPPWASTRTRGNIQAQSDPFRPAGVFHTIETLEEMRQVIRRDAIPAVRHRHHHFPIVLPGLHLHRRAGQQNISARW